MERQSGTNIQPWIAKPKNQRTYGASEFRSLPLQQQMEYRLRTIETKLAAASGFERWKRIRTRRGNVQEVPPLTILKRVGIHNDDGTEIMRRWDCFMASRLLPDKCRCGHQHRPS